MADPELNQTSADFEKNRNERIARRFQSEIVPLAVEKIRPLTELFKHTSNTELFNETVPILQSAIYECVKMIEERDFRAINPRLRLWILMCLVAGVNNLLAGDYPHIFTLRDGGDGAFYFSANQFSKLVNAKYRANRAFVPYITMGKKQGPDDEQKQKVISVEIVSDIDAFIGSKTDEYFLQFA